MNSWITTIFSRKVQLHCSIFFSILSTSECDWIWSESTYIAKTISEIWRLTTVEDFTVTSDLLQPLLYSHLLFLWVFVTGRGTTTYIIQHNCAMLDDVFRFRLEALDHCLPAPCLGLWGLSVPGLLGIVYIILTDDKFQHYSMMLMSLIQDV